MNLKSEDIQFQMILDINFAIFLTFVSNFWKIKLENRLETVVITYSSSNFKLLNI